MNRLTNYVNGGVTTIMNKKSVTRTKKCHNNIQSKKSVTISSILLKEYNTSTRIDETIFSGKSLQEIVNPSGQALESLYDQFRLDYPDYKEHMARKNFIKYIVATESYLRCVLQYKLNKDSKVIYVSLNELRRLSPRMTLEKNGKKHYAFDVFGKGKHMFSVLTKGSHRKQILTQIYMDKSYLNFLLEVNDPKAIELYYKDEDLTQANWLPVNRISLESFIRSTKNQLKKPRLHKKLKETLENNLRSAERTLNVAQYFKEERNGLYMPHIENPSPYGRMYYKKRNLQQIHKEVRKAIIGDHYEYDLVAAVYAIRLLLARQIFIMEGEIPQEEQLFPLTINYVKDRSTIRNDLLRHFNNTYNPQKAIKTVITAISFGAKFNAHAYKDTEGNMQTPSIEAMIPSDIDRANFLKDPWVIQFRQEQNKLSDFIFEYYKDMPGLIDKIKDIPEMYSPVNKILRKSKLLAYLFQTTEYEIMDNITKNLDYIIRIHDSVIMRKKILVHERQDISWRLKNDYAPYIELEESTTDGYFNISEEKQEDMSQHKQLIKQQEQKIANELNRTQRIQVSTRQ